MESRSHFNKSTAELETIYRNNIDNIAILNDILKELQDREKPKAVRLRNEITSTLAKKNRPTLLLKILSNKQLHRILIY